MQVSLGRRGDYSVRAVLDVARQEDGTRRKAREIAAAMDIPPRYLSQILANLVRNGLLAAVAGPDGGYSMARPASDVTLLDVVEAAEGPVTLDRCVLRGGPCDWTATCPIHTAWSRAQNALVERLAATTFAELAEVDAAIEAGSHREPSDVPAHPTPTRRRGIRRPASDPG